MRVVLLGVLLTLACNPQQQTRPQRPMKDLAHFRLLTKDSTMSDVKRLAGEPDGDMGSGIYVYFWKLDDGTQVLVGTPDNIRLFYVDWMRSDGTKERLFGAEAK
jgi:hypothetical protein